MASIVDSIKNVLPNKAKNAAGHTAGGNQTVNGVPYKGLAIHDHANWSDFRMFDIKPKNWTEDDVEIEITHCGVCGSDVHTITGGWGDAPLPIVPGHEIVGKAVRVGSDVKGISVGQTVGVGAQIWSCMNCRACHSNNENYCPKMVDTYGPEYPDGVQAQGGYSTAIRAHQQFVFPIPTNLEPRYAASMLCAGLTVYSPLVRNGAGPGKKVGIVGIGGLGHYAVLFAKALGAEVTAITHSNSKDDDIKQMGADHIIHTNEKDWEKSYAQTFDLIVSTRDAGGDEYPLQEYLSMLWIEGTFITVGLPDEKLPAFSPGMFAPNAAKFGVTHIGSKVEALAMLQLAADKGIKPWIEELPMSQAKKAVEGVHDNSVRYRYVLHQDLLPGGANQA